VSVSFEDPERYVLQVSGECWCPVCLVSPEGGLKMSPGILSRAVWFR
jgi:hypothetical protein